jgi:hypothetical protein
VNSSVSIAVYIHPYKSLRFEILSLFRLHIASNSYRNELKKSVVITTTGSVYGSVGDADPQTSR